METLLCTLLSEIDVPETVLQELRRFSAYDWEKLSHLSKIHGLAPVVYQKITKYIGSDSINHKSLDQMHDAAFVYTARNMLFLHEAEKIIKILQNSNIKVIGLKGIYLLENIYKNVSLRPMSDLDLMVKREDIPKAICQLEKVGFTQTTYFKQEFENIDIKHVPPMANSAGMMVELHWTLLEENEPFTIDVDGLWERAIPVKIAGIDALALNNEDLLLHLCIHFAYQHYLKAGLRYLYDFVEILKLRKMKVEWTQLIDRSIEWGAGRTAQITFTLVNDLFGEVIPAKVLENLPSFPIAPKILSEAKNQVFSKGEIQEKLTPDLVNLSTTKGFYEKIKLIVSRIFIPKRVIARLYNADPQSIWIYGYYFFRLRDLFINYARLVWPIIKMDKRISESIDQEQISMNIHQWLVNGR